VLSVKPNFSRPGVDGEQVAVRKKASAGSRRPAACSGITGCPLTSVSSTIRKLPVVTNGLRVERREHVPGCVVDVPAKPFDNHNIRGRILPLGDSVMRRPLHFSDVYHRDLPATDQVAHRSDEQRASCGGGAHLHDHLQLELEEYVLVDPPIQRARRYGNAQPGRIGPRCRLAIEPVGRLGLSHVRHSDVLLLASERSVGTEWAFRGPGEREIP
jgi:hypothetical protein